ncbi:MAG: hypothetical protein KTR31_37490 [Myxococcales bacterium]|nr:hypothetical protein [Myxococcales bacterium]
MIWKSTVAAALLALATAGPALAAPEPSHGEPTAAHGDAAHGAADGHGHDDGAHGDAADADHGDGHGDGHGAHHYYTDDDDHDGTPNWRDPMDGVKENSLYVVPSLSFHLLNLAILIGLIVYFVRRPIADVFRNRALGIRKELTDSARRRDEAHQRHQDMVARLDRIEQEVSQMHEDAKEEAAREEQRLLERAEREAVRIGEQAERSIRDETTRATNALRREAVELAVKLAENTLRSSVASADQQSLAEAFLTSLKQDEEGAPHGG